MIGARYLVPLAIEITWVVPVQIVYTGEKYQGRQNYPSVEFRIVTKKQQFFASCPFSV